MKIPDRLAAKKVMPALPDWLREMVDGEGFAERCGELSEPVPCEDPAEEMFIRISKANDACARPAPLCPRTPRALKAAFCLRRLTDPEIRENYEKYGHPVCSLLRGNGAWVLSLTSAGRLRRMGDRP